MRKLLVIGSIFGLVIAGPLAADVFTVTMTSGGTFASRYQPHQSDTEEGKVLLLTEYGNWISLPKEAIVSVVSNTEAKGFGTVLDSQTIALGWIPPSSKSAIEDEAEVDATTQLINFMREQNTTAPAPVFTNELVVEPSQSTGIPMSFTNQSTPPLGATQGVRRR